MHGGVLVGAIGAVVVLAAGLGETLVADGLVELAAEVPDRATCCDPHAVSPAQAKAKMAINRIVQIPVLAAAKRRSLLTTIELTP